MRAVSLVAVVVMTVAFVAVAAAAEVPFAKNRCLLYSEGCPFTQESLPERIEHIKQELSRGHAVYTEAELARLRGKLEEAEALLDILLYHPGS